MKKYIILFLFLSFIIGGIYFYQQNKSENITYLTEIVERGNLQKNVVATGTIRALKRVEVGAQASGRIEKIWVSLGQQVKAGDLIAEIDSQNQRNALETAQARLSSYQAQLNAKNVSYDVAKSNFLRIQKLYSQKSTSLNELDNAKNSLANAEAAIKEITASIKQAEIEVKIAKTNLGYTKIHSPIDGTVISIPVSEGQTVNANQITPTIIQVADLSKLLIRLEISEGDITKIHPGMKVEFSTLSDPDHKFHSQINSVDPALTTLSDNEYKESVATTNAVYFYANSIVDNPTNQLRIGMTAQAQISVANIKNTLLIRTATIKREGSQTFVNVLKNGAIEKRQIQIGQNDEARSQILSGLAEGEKVVSSQIIEGEKIGNSPRRVRMF
ncbi:efflux transporter periplasmic adaptor subunit [Vespertiliibacter pulmonis]|uniref:Macrolide-specific efflux system membrane fusion protein n=1 Tax=Vespertiliibacter pulmonis TaxID=1443036 RepID=A0A3N4VYV0_9PAST|nr:efflux RND transporter periplasmic adaptor subunit [Vespertiliibacter pulmonis]QLB20359.1 efflux transporter periplasmic adaptor subunit [Vespertiliibacter pulmonis]RPE86345.1 macrolide-specific efflux system membrane fusion protein [Vespertiliibacter pulmonis]